MRRSSLKYLKIAHDLWRFQDGWACTLSVNSCIMEMGYVVRKEGIFMKRFQGALALALSIMICLSSLALGLAEESASDALAEAVETGMEETVQMFEAPAENVQVSADIPEEAVQETATADSEGEKPQDAAETAPEETQEVAENAEANAEPTAEAPDAPVNSDALINNEATPEPLPEIGAEEGEAPCDEAEQETEHDGDVQPEETEEAEETNLSATAAEQPDFNRGYARLVREAVAYESAAPSAEALYYLVSGVFYVNDRCASSECDRLEVYFDDGEGEASAWVDAEELCPMDNAQCRAFVLARSAEANVRFCSLDAALPLDAVFHTSVTSYALMAADVQVDLPAMLVEQTELRIGQKEKRAILPSFSDGNSYAVTYASDNDRVAAVDGDGVITGKNRGSTTIHIYSELGNEASVKVTVLQAPKSIKLSAPRSQLGVGETMNLTVMLNQRYASALSYTSSQSAVAQVDENGCVQAVGTGTATISVKTYNGKTARTTVTVLPAPTSLAFDAEVLEMGVGENRSLNAVPNGGSAGTILYESDAPDILQLDAATGRITALAPGEAMVTATAHSGVSATQKVLVKAAPSCIRLAQNTMIIGVGEKIALPEVTVGAEGEDCAGGYSLKTSSTKYVSVSDGMLLGRRRGSATITVTTYNGLSAQLKVTVQKAPSKITMNTASAVLGVGEGMYLSVKLPAKTAGGVIYASDNEVVASVTPAGEVLACAPGSAIITARSFNGKTAQCAVTVKAAPESVSFDRDEIILGAGEALKLGVHMNEGSAGSYVLESLNSAIASVDGSGKLTAKAAGEAQIQVSTYNGKTAVCTVQVKPAPEGIRLATDSITLCVGDSYKIPTPEVLGENAACSAFSYTSSATKYVSVSADGVITAKRVGTKQITVKTYNGKSAKMKVTVKAAPKSISMSESTATLYIGLTLTPTVNFANGISGSYRLSSSNEAVAAISADGRSVIAVSAGDVQITATSFNGKTAAMQLHVPALPESVALEPAQMVLGVGDVYALNTVLSPQNAGCKLNYASSNPAVVSVSESGEVSACAPGSAIVTVETMNGLRSESSITVKAAPTALSLSPRNAVRCLDEESLHLNVAFGAEDQGGRVRFSSSNTAVATVSADGWVQFTGVGTVRITAKSYNGHSAVCDLAIGERPTKMFFAQESTAIALGDTVNIPLSFDKGCESYSYSVADAQIAAVSGEELTALSCGTTTLTATSRSGLTASCTLEVVSAPTGLSLMPESAELMLHAETTIQLNAKALPNGVGSVYYRSSDTAVATVDSATGKVTAQGAGSCLITATTYDGKHSAQCAITVRNLLHGVKIGIDPGHQRRGDYSKEANSPYTSKRKAKVTSGTAGRYTRVPEYVVNLQIGLKLRDELEKYGATVYMTRETHDVNISNRQRAEMMNELGVDMTLRIHLNGNKKSSANGMMSYVRKTGPCKEESVAISELVLKYMAAETGANNRGVKYSDNYTGQNWSTVPCLMLELGYMTNPKEDRLLVTDAYQEKLVRGLVQGICEYMERENPYK